MDTFAVIKLGGHQYKIFPGQVFSTQKMAGKEGDVVDLDMVLLYKNKENLEIGTPYLNIPVKVKIVKKYKGEKIDVFKYKSKVRYRRHTGFRPQLTQLEVIQIGDQKKPSPKEKKEENTVKPAKSSPAKAATRKKLFTRTKKTS